MEETGIGAMIKRGLNRLWEHDYRSAAVPVRTLVGAARIAVLVGRDFFRGDLTLRAMSLVYTTLLSLVPLLAFSFSVLKGLGAHNAIEPWLMSYLAPLGQDQAQRVTGNIINFVDNMNVGVLGAVGLGFLVYTVISLMQKIEAAFNSVWRVESERSFVDRFATFLSALTVGPLLVFAALALTASLINDMLDPETAVSGALRPVVEVAARLVPYVLVVLAFSFLYVFVPNTHVTVQAALAGGLVAGVLWETVGWIFGSFATGASRYEAIYATFASLVLFMIWLYLSWLTLLVGASVAFYQQHPELVRAGFRGLGLSRATEESSALAALLHVAQRFYEGGAAPTLEEIARELEFPSYVTEPVLLLLCRAGLVIRTSTEKPTYVPGVPLESMQVAEVLRIIREQYPRDTRPAEAPRDARVLRVMALLERELQEALGGLTVKQLATESHDDLDVRDADEMVPRPRRVR